jgi:hypothetical protein
MSREQLLADALRLEDKELEARKDLWIISMRFDGSERILIVEAVTAPGAVGIAQTLDLIDYALTVSGELKLHGPHARDCWPEEYWYRWLTEADVAEMEARLS